MKFTKKMTFGALATVAVVALPIVAVVSCGDKDDTKGDSTNTNGSNTKNGVKKFDAEITSSSTVEDFREIMNKIDKYIPLEKPVLKDIVFKISDQYFTVKKGLEEEEEMKNFTINKIVPEIEKINPDLAKKIMQK